MYSRLILLFASVLVGSVLSLPQTCHAGLMIDIGDTSVAPGESGFVDVLVSSDSADSFQSFWLTFNVSGPAHAVAPINFVESSIVAPQLSATGPDYIFLGDSGAQQLPWVVLDLVADPAGLPNANDLIDVQDQTSSWVDRTISAGDGPFLLARLNFVAPANATLGQVYDVALDAWSYGFDDASLIAPPSFVSTPGSITIAASTVPEPSSIVILAVGSLVSIGYRRRKRARTLAFLG